MAGSLGPSPHGARTLVAEGQGVVFPQIVGEAEKSNPVLVDFLTSRFPEWIGWGGEGGRVVGSGGSWWQEVPKTQFSGPSGLGVKVIGTKHGACNSHVFS